VLKPEFSLRTTIVVQSLPGIADVRAQHARRANLSGKWQLRTKAVKGKEEIWTLDLTQSGSSVVGTATPLQGKAMTISHGYCVGVAIKLSATGRQGLFFRSMEISGHIKGDKMILKVKKGNGSTFSAIAERTPETRQG